MAQGVQPAALKNARGIHPAAGEQPQASVSTEETEDENSLPRPWGIEGIAMLCGAHKPGRPWKSPHWGQDSCWVLCHTLVSTVENAWDHVCSS